MKVEHLPTKLNKKKNFFFHFGSFFTDISKNTQGCFRRLKGPILLCLAMTQESELSHSALRVKDSMSALNAGCFSRFQTRQEAGVAPVVCQHEMIGLGPSLLLFHCPSVGAHPYPAQGSSGCEGGTLFIQCSLQPEILNRKAGSAHKLPILLMFTHSPVFKASPQQLGPEGFSSCHNYKISSSLLSSTQFLLLWINCISSSINHHFFIHAHTLKKVWNGVYHNDIVISFLIVLIYVFQFFYKPYITK